MQPNFQSARARARQTQIPESALTQCLLARLQSFFLLSPPPPPPPQLQKCKLCVTIEGGNFILQVAKLFSYTWTFGEFACKWLYYMQSVSVICSVLNLTALSFER